MNTLTAKAAELIRDDPAFAAEVSRQWRSTSAVGLTAKQREVWEFLVAYTDEQGIAPSFDEIREHVGLVSKSGVHRLLKGLEERGFISRQKGLARAMQIHRRAA
jgi:SOS-response transcriptional repressor LexA